MRVRQGLGTGDWWGKGRGSLSSIHHCGSCGRTNLLSVSSCSVQPAASSARTWLLNAQKEYTAAHAHACVCVKHLGWRFSLWTTFISESGPETAPQRALKPHLTSRTPTESSGPQKNNQPNKQNPVWVLFNQCLNKPIPRFYVLCCGALQLDIRPIGEAWLVNFK